MELGENIIVLCSNISINEADMSIPIARLTAFNVSPRTRNNRRRMSILSSPTLPGLAFPPSPPDGVHCATLAYTRVWVFLLSVCFLSAVLRIVPGTLQRCMVGVQWNVCEVNE